MQPVVVAAITLTLCAVASARGAYTREAVVVGLASGALVGGFAVRPELCANAHWSVCAATNPVTTLAVALIALSPGPTWCVVRVCTPRTIYTCVNIAVYVLLLPALLRGIGEAIALNQIALFALFAASFGVHAGFALMKFDRRTIAMTPRALALCTFGTAAFAWCAFALNITDAVRNQLVLALALALAYRAFTLACAPSLVMWVATTQGTAPIAI